MTSTDEYRQAVVVALANSARGRAHWVSAIVEMWRVGIDPAAHWLEVSSSIPDDVPKLDPPVDETLASTNIDGLVELIAAERERGTRLVTVLDKEYPRNLRGLSGRPPYLWVRGSVTAMASEMSIAIVGTRQASDAALSDARDVSRRMAEAGVTVFSGLALGIDTAAHAGAMAGAGTTIAVMGTGTGTVYPRSNEHLAEEIISSGGALVSQFMPEKTGRRWTFPMRNAVMSGMVRATLVIEASEMSGAKLQARIALKQDKQLMLWHSLADAEPWARRYVDSRGATRVSTAEQVLEILRSTEPPIDQLALS